MCGIAGVLGGDARALGPMIGALAHRGPTASASRRAGPARTWPTRACRSSTWRAAGSRCARPARPSSATASSTTTSSWPPSIGLGAVLATGSDYEPFLRLAASEGAAAIERLRGMYALCLVTADGRTVLSRDPFGIKPLYLMQAGEGLAFASEPRAFFAGRLMAPVLDVEAAREFLDLNYTLGTRTLFQGLRRLAPGETIEVRAGQIVSSHRKAPFGRRALPGDEAALLTTLDAVLEDSVKVHQRSDVPYGLFLSGGIDSAAIATLMARLNERPVTAFTCGFDAPGAADERRPGRGRRQGADLDWRETSFGEADFWRILPQVAWALDDPTADYATLPTYKLAEAAKGTLTVVLTGEGGDELFAGYGRYRRALRPTWLGGRPASRAAPARRPSPPGVTPPGRPAT
jgi:asparagine synthase (glutamine-hydrolysing)